MVRQARLWRGWCRRWRAYGCDNLDGVRREMVIYWVLKGKSCIWLEEMI